MVESLSRQAPISPEHISANALSVIRRLNLAGFSGLLVGGGVRDLLLGRKPKDFDIATDAEPREVRELFGNSRVVGRRFRIVHVRFGREVIEVTTFRGPHREEDAEKGGGGTRKTANGRLLRDNVYGTIEEDAARRDFTINSLYYDPERNRLLDLESGLKDLQAGVVRLIGEPEVRYREDPVRMLRALRFAAKLGFRLDGKTAAPIRRLGGLLSEVPAARLFDEVLKLFLAGHAEATFALLMEYNLLPRLFPDTSLELHDPVLLALVRMGLRSTDQRVARELPVAPAFLYALLLWPFLCSLMREAGRQQDSKLEAYYQVVGGLIDRQQPNTALPRWLSQTMREIWELQFLMQRHRGKRAERLLSHPRFRAGYDFLLLRVQAGEPLQELAEWWTILQQTKAAAAPKQPATPRKRARKRRRRPLPGLT